MKCLQSEAITLKRRSSKKPRWWPQQNAKTLHTYEDLSSSDVDKIDQYIAQEGAFDGEEHDLEEIAVFTGDTETGNSIQNWASLVNRYLRSNNKWGKKKEIKTTQPSKKQVAKVDGIMWTESIESGDQRIWICSAKVQSVLFQALVQVIKLMQCARNDDSKETKDSPGGILKLLVQGVLIWSSNRKEKKVMC